MKSVPRPTLDIFSRTQNSHTSLVQFLHVHERILLHFVSAKASSWKSPSLVIAMMYSSGTLFRFYYWALCLIGARAQTPRMLGPLTTLFTAPTSCTATVHTGRGNPHLFLGWQDNEYSSPDVNTQPLDPVCFPSGWTMDFTYFPGVCPSGE